MSIERIILVFDGERVRCKIEMKRGVDYVISNYVGGDFGHVSYDFIMKKGAGIEPNKEIGNTKRGSVYNDFNIILNTKSAMMNMIRFAYPICQADNGITINEENDGKIVSINPGMCIFNYFQNM